MVRHPICAELDRKATYCSRRPMLHAFLVHSEASTTMFTIISRRHHPSSHVPEDRCFAVAIFGNGALRGACLVVIFLPPRCCALAISWWRALTPALAFRSHNRSRAAFIVWASSHRTHEESLLRAMHSTVWSQRYVPLWPRHMVRHVNAWPFLLGLCCCQH